MQPYIGSGPYCYSNSLTMMLGDPAISPSTIEVLTGSPFGFQLLAGKLPLFDPYGWDPDQGLDATIDLLGWTCVRQGADDDEQAMAQLRDALKSGPVLAGPVEMGLLGYHPDMGQAIGADHFIVVTSVDDDSVTCHDPHGFPYATLPVTAFLSAWRADSIGYKATQYTMRSSFRPIRTISALDALRTSLPAAQAWLRQRSDLEVPPGTLGGAAAAERLAEMLTDGLTPQIHGHLVAFAIRVGARRLADAATAFSRLGLHEAAAIADRQSQLVGSMQFDVVAGYTAKAAQTMRRLAPTYLELADALADARLNRDQALGA